MRLRAAIHTTSILLLTVGLQSVSTVGSALDGSIEAINEALTQGNLLHSNRKPALSFDSMPFRLHHARELLGKHYNKSVVKVGESVLDLREFISNKVYDSLRGKWKKKSEQVSDAILKEANRYHFDPMFLMAVIQNESSFSTDIVGSFGEIGLMQIKPSTAKWIAKKTRIPYLGAKSLKNPVVNIQLGAALLDMLREKFDHGRLYLSAYNMGATNVRKSLRKQVWPRDYSEKVMQHYVALYRELAENMKDESALPGPESIPSAPSETVAEVYHPAESPEFLPVYKD